jgi:hypothetical protein
MLARTPHVISLPSYNVEKRKQGWYYWKAPFFSRENPKGPYGTISSVCFMIAKELISEVVSQQRKVDGKRK